MMAYVQVAAQTAYPVSAASPRVRLAGFVPHLEAHSVDLRYESTLSEGEYDVINSEAGPLRKATVLGRATARLIAGRARPEANELLLVHRLRFLAPIPGLEPARRVDAYDFDDALYLGSILRSNRRFGWLKREGERWLSYVRRARVVVAGNSHLAERAREHASVVEVIPSCVDPERQPRREHRDEEVVTIGWIGSRSTVDQLRTVFPAIAALNEGEVRVRLVLVGAEGLALRAPWLERRPWSLDSEPRDLASFDIGVMPLPDSEWTRGKCGYKLLQYFSAGVPAVASPVGVNRRIVGAGGERGLLATTDDEWKAALGELIRDHRVRAEMGARARSFVEREYSYQRWAPELAALLADL
jgi:glycosyltransferase involved in cell wall biosynthesis